MLVKHNCRSVKHDSRFLTISSPQVPLGASNRFLHTEMHIATYMHNVTLIIVQVLQEEYQVLPNGVTRARGVPLSEKMKASEAWSDAVLRAIKEELGSVLPLSPEVSN